MSGGAEVEEVVVVERAHRHFAQQLAVMGVEDDMHHVGLRAVRQGLAGEHDGIAAESEFLPLLPVLELALDLGRDVDAGVLMERPLHRFGVAIGHFEFAADLAQRAEPEHFGKRLRGLVDTVTCSPKTDPP